MEVNPPDSLFLRSTDDKSGKFYLSLTSSNCLIETSNDSMSKYMQMKTKVIKKEPLPNKCSPSQQRLKQNPPESQNVVPPQLPPSPPSTPSTAKIYGRGPHPIKRRVVVQEPSPTTESTPSSDNSSKSEQSEAHFQDQLHQKMYDVQITVDNLLSFLMKTFMQNSP